MMAFTADGQVKPELVAARDARYGVNTAGGLGWAPRQAGRNRTGTAGHPPAAVATSCWVLRLALASRHACPALPPAADKGRQRRELLDWPEATDPAADHWQGGRAWQVAMEQVPFTSAVPPAAAP